MTQNVIEELRGLAAAADQAIVNNVPESEGHLYVKRGKNECCVAKPQCREWALYLSALVKHGPALLAVAEAASFVAASLYDDDIHYRKEMVDLRVTLSRLTAQGTTP